MRLSDIMSKLHLTAWVEVALLIFFTLFVGVMLYLVLFTKKQHMDRMARLPLDGGKGESASTLVAPNGGSDD